MEPATSEKKKKQVIVKPIVYGSVASMFTKKREEDKHTHQWTVYVRPYTNEDMSMWVKKVQFTLHETFSNPHRTIMRPPYEVTETGWGEFDIVIKIFINDADYPEPITLHHHLKLFPGKGEVAQRGKNTVVAEVCDEIAFVDPSPMMLQILNSSRALVIDEAYKHETDFEEQKVKQRKAIEDAQGRIDREMRELKARIKLTNDAISHAKLALQSLPSSGFTH